MKKIISMALCLIVLVCAFCMAISGADEVPRPVGTKELTTLNALPTSDPLVVDLTENMTAPAVYSSYGYNPESLSEYDRWELNRYLTYGITVNGVHALKRPLDTAIDNVWTNGNVNANGASSLANGSKRNGAVEFLVGKTLYNVNGETGKDNSRYQCYMTFNFNQLANIDSFGFIGNSYGNQFAAYDVFVSKDGENWDNVGYVDQLQRKVDGTDDYTYIDAKALGEDALGKVFTNDQTVENNCGAAGRLYLYDLDGVEAQFLRICVTVYQRCSVTDHTVYENHVRQYTDFQSASWRDMVVYGTKLDKPNTVTATEAAAPQTTETPTLGNNIGGLIPTKPSKTEATEATTTAETTTAAETTAEEKSGCGSSVGVSMIAMAITAVGVTTVAIGRKKRR